MKKIGILSDTHAYLHPDAFEFFKECDEIWHAGDIMDDFILDGISAARFRRIRSSSASNTRWPFDILWVIRASMTPERWN